MGQYSYKNKNKISCPTSLSNQCHDDSSQFVQCCDSVPPSNSTVDPEPVEICRAELFSCIHVNTRLHVTVWGKNRQIYLSVIKVHLLIYT